MGRCIKECRMKNLVIGKTAQVAQYFPRDDFEYISSRNINTEEIQKSEWDRVYICSAEQRTFYKEAEFEKYNVDTTINLIDRIKNNCGTVVVYSTAELWNKVHGAVDLETPHHFNATPYIASKKKMTDILLQNNEEYSNITIFYPFNFNSTHRRHGFLFHKIFHSIIHRQKIEIGDTYFYRELLHPKFVADRSMNLEEDSLIGSGRVTFVNDFIRDLYHHSGLNYNEYVTENIDYKKKADRDIYFLSSQECHYSYDSLLSDTLEDIRRASAGK